MPRFAVCLALLVACGTDEPDPGASGDDSALGDAAPGPTPDTSTEPGSPMDTAPTADTSSATAPGPADVDDDGFDDTVDCDDLHPLVYPGAPERCDGVDEDCDGIVDEDAPEAVTGYPDLDLDGAGDELTAVTACELPPGFVTVAGDCDDADPDRRPGAPELCDGLDNDCDAATSEDGVASVDGLAFTSVQAAIDAAGDGAVITVCDGTYLEHLAVPPVTSLTIVSLNGPEATILDGSDSGQVLVSDAELLTLEGLTFTRGYVDEGAGAGIEVAWGDLVLTGCVLEANNTYEGGGLKIYQSTATITDTVFRANTATYAGGAMLASYSDVTLRDCLFEDNASVTSGGALYNRESELYLERTDFDGNASFDGGAIYQKVWSATEIVDGVFSNNDASGRGGAVYSGAPLTVAGTTFDGNSAKNGGALALEADAVLDGIVVVNNTATKIGGGMLADAVIELSNATIHANRAESGGGLGTMEFADGTFASTASDWGDAATANLPEDVFLTEGSQSYDVAGDFTCDLIVSCL